jgi:undecaprenyl-diphosphatase
MRRPEPALSLRHAIALGLLQGPTELLPVSSSAHTSLIPWLGGWPYTQLDGETRKTFEVVLHAGAGFALAIDMRAELVHAASEMDRRRATALALALAPAAIAGAALQAPIERGLGGPRSIAAGLGAGAMAMALADRWAGGGPWRAGKGAGRSCEGARASDGLVLGLAQASALIPGVSRSGATLTAARARGFARGDAERLSWLLALPVILGASLLKGIPLLRRGAVEQRGALATGGVAAFLSTFASARILRRGRHGGRALLPYALYRCLLAALVMRRLRRGEQAR